MAKISITNWIMSGLSYLSTFNAPLSHEPEYSNLGYAILGYIHLSDRRRSVAALASRMIFQPLAMRNSSYLPADLREYPRRPRPCRRPAEV